MPRTRKADTSPEFEVRHVRPSDSTALNEMTGFAASHETPSPFQSGAIVEVYSKTRGCKPIAFMAADAEKKTIAALASTVFMDAGPVVVKLVSHAVCRGGPLFKPTKRGMMAGEASLMRLLESVKGECLYTRVYPLLENRDQISVLSHLGFSREDWLNYMIDLTKGKQATWDGMSKHRRKGIRRAEQLGLDMVEVSTMDDLDTMYQILVATHEAAKIPLQDKSLFEALHRIMVPKGLAKMVMAYEGGAPVASRVVLTFSGIIYDWYAGSVESREEVNANEFLVWQLLRAPNHTWTFYGEVLPGAMGVLVLAAVIPGVLEMVRHSGLADRLGRERMLFNARAAIERYQALLAAERGTPPAVS